MPAHTKPQQGGPAVVISGVSGSGKSTIGALIAIELDVPFVDADSLHPVANIEKMAAGHPLDDDDRWPWLAAVGRNLAEARTAGMVIACSALKRDYRDAIRRESPEVIFVQLDGSREVLGSRLEGRSGHFMPPALLDSQLAARCSRDARSGRTRRSRRHRPAGSARGRGRGLGRAGSGR